MYVCVRVSERGGGRWAEVKFSLRYIHHKEKWGLLWPGFISDRLGAMNPGESEKMCQSQQSAGETATAAALNWVGTGCSGLFVLFVGLGLLFS